MLAELLEYLVTPCSREARSLGYLTESVAIRARHRRLKEAWRPHLEKSREAVLTMARECPEGGSVLILGSGSLLDVPLKELAAHFGRVLLADMVHPLSVRLRALRSPKVELLTVDLTGVAGDAARGIMAVPCGPEALADAAPELVVSLNVLSQLPLLPVKALQRTGSFTGPELDEFSRDILASHVNWLNRFTGRKLLICDAAWIEGDRVSDPLGGLSLPDPLASWEWSIAPRPEIRPDADALHRVAAFRLG